MQQDNILSQFDRWRFLVRWILLNTVGQLVLNFVFLEWDLITNLQLFDPFLELWSFQWFVRWLGNGVIGGLVTGLVIGGLQWFLLQRYFDWAGKWLIFSLFGSILVTLWAEFIGIFLFSSPRLTVPLVFMSSFVAGALQGTMQWLVLRHHVNRAGWWIVASGLTLFTSSFLFFIATQLGIVNTFTPYELMNRIDKIVRLLISESILATCLIWLLNPTSSNGRL